MKLNFGHGIFAFYVVFMSLLAFQVYKSTTVDRSLVADDYYALDIAYQQTLEARARAKAYPISLTQAAEQGGGLVLAFPDGHFPRGGTLHLQRPDNRAPDERHTVDAVGNTLLLVETNNLLPGAWGAQLDYEWQGEAYSRNYKLFIH